ncbi:chromosomal replication initiator protein DnaA [Babesia caballi]|uniref:Chromosomal replication initiator protein DnaA n=1 Tax=Babesia caballi TaxID=5871 RepID=A0AAV4LQ51_BABCB|nr:chromosomal replication initiator protein DnaA [Babesia caballi]
MTLRNSLLEMPSNFKESLDWIITVGECGVLPLVGKSIFEILLRNSAAGSATSVAAHNRGPEVPSQGEQYNDEEPTKGSLTSPPKGTLTLTTGWLEGLLCSAGWRQPVKKEVGVRRFARHLVKYAEGLDNLVVVITRNSLYQYSYEPSDDGKELCERDPSKFARIFLSLFMPVYKTIRAFKAKCNAFSYYFSPINDAGPNGMGHYLHALGYEIRQLCPAQKGRHINGLTRAFEEHEAVLHNLISRYSNYPYNFQPPSEWDITDDDILTAAAGAAILNN